MLRSKTLAADYIYIERERMTGLSELRTSRARHKQRLSFVPVAFAVAYWSYLLSQEMNPAACTAWIKTIQVDMHLNFWMHWLPTCLILGSWLVRFWRRVLWLPVLQWLKFRLKDAKMLLVTGPRSSGPVGFSLSSGCGSPWTPLCDLRMSGASWDASSTAWVSSSPPL